MDAFAEELIERLGSTFDLVVAAAKRAKQLRDGAKPLVETEARNPLTVALLEIAEGKIVLQKLEPSQLQEGEQAQAPDYLARRGSVDKLPEKAVVADASEE